MASTYLYAKRLMYIHSLATLLFTYRVCCFLTRIVTSMKIV